MAAGSNPAGGTQFEKHIRRRTRLCNDTSARPEFSKGGPILCVVRKTAECTLLVHLLYLRKISRNRLANTSNRAEMDVLVC